MELTFEDKKRIGRCSADISFFKNNSDKNVFVDNHLKDSTKEPNGSCIKCRKNGKKDSGTDLRERTKYLNYVDEFFLPKVIKKAEPKLNEANLNGASLMQTNYLVSKLLPPINPTYKITIETQSNSKNDINLNLGTKPPKASKANLKGNTTKKKGKSSRLNSKNPKKKHISSRSVVMNMCPKEIIPIPCQNVIDHSIVEEKLENLSDLFFEGDYTIVSGLDEVFQNTTEDDIKSDSSMSTLFTNKRFRRSDAFIILDIFDSVANPLETKARIIYDVPKNPRII